MGELTKEIWIDAPPETVYRFLVEPELTVRWFGEQSWNEARPGGRYRVSVRGNVVAGEFVELDPGRRHGKRGRRRCGGTGTPHRRVAARVPHRRDLPPRYPRASPARR